LGVVFEHGVYVYCVYYTAYVFLKSTNQSNVKKMDLLAMLMGKRIMPPKLKDACLALCALSIMILARKLWTSQDSH
jgi:hypothetical protein